MIDRLIQPASDADVRGLALLLIDAVESGAAVSFLAPLTLEGAEGWWRKMLSAPHSRAIFLLTLDARRDDPTVRPRPGWKDPS